MPHLKVFLEFDYFSRNVQNFFNPLFFIVLSRFEESYSILSHVFLLYFKTLTRFPIEEIYFICFMQEVKFFKTKPVIW